MRHILLLDADPDHGAAVADALRVIYCETKVCSDLRDAISALRETAFEAVVVAPSSHGDWMSAVDKIRHAASQLPEHPSIICLIRGPYRGPNERVYAARKGFTVAYER